jgi:hypothetical protein
MNMKSLTSLVFFLLAGAGSTWGISTAELGEGSGPCDSDVTGKPCGLVDGYVGMEYGTEQIFHGCEL